MTKMGGVGVDGIGEGGGMAMLVSGQGSHCH